MVTWPAVCLPDLSFVLSPLFLLEERAANCRWELRQSIPKHRGLPLKGLHVERSPCRCMGCSTKIAGASKLHSLKLTWKWMALPRKEDHEILYQQGVLTPFPCLVSKENMSLGVVD